MGMFSEADEREEDYWDAVVENKKYRAALEKGIITRKQYQLLRNTVEDDGITGHQWAGCYWNDDDDEDF